MIADDPWSPPLYRRPINRALAGPCADCLVPLCTLCSLPDDSQIDASNAAAVIRRRLWPGYDEPQSIDCRAVALAGPTTAGEEDGR